MTLKNAIRRLFGRNDTPSAPALRNKPGGMAWIKGVNHGNGAEQMNGRAVRVVSLKYGRMWAVDPVQRVTFTKDTLYTRQDVLVRTGETYTIDGIADDCLEPWKDVGDDERDESLSYLPPVPASLVNIVKERL